MADKKFSELPAATTPAGTEVVPIVQGGATKRTTAQAIADLASRAWANITGKPTTLVGYGITDAATAAQGALADTATQPGDLATVATTGAYSDLTGKPTLGSAAAQDTTAFAAAVHVHAASDITSGTFANVRVAQSNVTQHQAALSIAWSQLTSLPSFFSGDVGDLTGFPGGTTNFLRADGTFAAPPGAGSVSWGGITGTLADQEDLQSALDAKADSATTLAGYGITDAATSSQGALADSAVQPGDLADVATSGAYDDLTGLPTLGTAAAQNSTAFATAAQGATADTALQADDVAGFSIAWSQVTGEPTTLSGYGITDAAPAARTISTTAPLTGGGDLSANRTIAIPAATASVDGYATSTQITKLNGIATGATANDTDANLKARANHTGTQAASTISDFNTAADARVTLKPECLVVAVSDETTALTTGTAKVTFRMPYAFTLTTVRGSLTVAQASGSILTVDINEGGTTILSTKLTIDNTEKTSTTAAAAPVISDASLADDAEITVDIDQIGNGSAKGLKIYLIGHQ